MASVDDTRDRESDESVDLMNATNLEYVMRSGGYDPDSVRGWVRRAAAHLGIDQASMTSPEEAKAFLDLVLAQSFDAFEKRGVSRAAAHAALAALLHSEAPMQERLDLGLPDDGDDAWTAELYELDADSARYRHLMARTRGGKITLAIPEILDGTGAASIAERWNVAKSSGGDAPSLVVDLALAIQNLEKLESLARLAEERGHITPQWEYVYPLGEPDGWGPEPFMGCLRTLLEVMRGLSPTLDEATVRAVMDAKRPGAFANVTGAAGHIDGDYRALRDYGNKRRDERLLSLLRSAGNTPARYDAMRRAVAALNPSEADEVREAVLKGRKAQPTDVERYLNRPLWPQERSLYPGSALWDIAGAVARAIRGKEGATLEADGRTTALAEWETRRKANDAGICIDPDALEILRALPEEYRSQAGVVCIAEAVETYASEYRRKNPGDGDIVLTPQVVLSILMGIPPSRKFNPNSYERRLAYVTAALSALGLVTVKPNTAHEYEDGRLVPKALEYMFLLRITASLENKVVSEYGAVTPHAFAISRHPVPILESKALTWNTQVREISGKVKNAREWVIQRLVEQAVEGMDYDRESPPTPAYQEKHHWKPRLSAHITKDQLLWQGDVDTDQKKKDSRQEVRYLASVEDMLPGIIERVNVGRFKKGKPPIQLTLQRRSTRKGKAQILDGLDVVWNWPDNAMPPKDWKKELRELTEGQGNPA